MLLRHYSARGRVAKPAPSKHARMTAVGRTIFSLNQGRRLSHGWFSVEPLGKRFVVSSLQVPIQIHPDAAAASLHFIALTRNKT